ncbi:hypothetical protein TVAG_312020 [Trichomonas vaginalis G3]|uniref:Uncharacterized protein n=1 Tax=Trichomonas vaginalis (strain ATCC PRA-98 / G3) TaxID=412133 RepID=A2H7I4_TRIV3|nr:hypothetical protein TVAG_312020 [Trichomonas vaginalis G3]|eukprot:XP_001287563.1 hypothetical protein [Trichomonas vaginalis G3]
MIGSLGTPETKNGFAESLISRGQMKRPSADGFSGALRLPFVMIGSLGTPETKNGFAESLISRGQMKRPLLMDSQEP